MTHTEYKLQVQICNYIKMQYSDIYFLSDTVANVKLTVNQQARNKAIQKGDFSCPDLIIFEPRGGYSGLFLELKKESPYLKSSNNNVLRKQPVKRLNKSGQVIEVYDHLEQQDLTLRRLREKGYMAEFCWSLDMAVKIIDGYMKG